MCKNLADTDIYIFEENMSMVVALHINVQSWDLDKPCN